MPPTNTVRRSLILPSDIAKQIERIGKRRGLSNNRVLIWLIEEGIAAERRRKEDFFRLAGRFRSAEDPAEIKRLGNEMGRFVFS